MPEEPLSTTNHDRDAAGLRYVYPVVSRRAGGLSVGINLNPNSACNWRCIYCQVPDLVRGAAPPIDGELLEAELRGFLGDVLEGDFLERRCPPGSRRLVDLAFSGNGEPTTARELPQLVERVGTVLQEAGLAGSLPLRLITNGSQVLRPEVQEALSRMATLGGEVWFKLDRATRAGRSLINDVAAGEERLREQLDTCARLCPTWLQTCLFQLDGAAPAEEELGAWLELVGGLVEAGTPLQGVHLYGLARPSLQPEAERLRRLPASWLETFAGRVRDLGLPAEVSP